MIYLYLGFKNLLSESITMLLINTILNIQIFIDIETLLKSIRTEN